MRGQSQSGARGLRTIYLPASNGSTLKLALVKIGITAGLTSGGAPKDAGREAKFSQFQIVRLTPG